MCQAVLEKVREGEGDTETEKEGERESEGRSNGARWLRQEEEGGEGAIDWKKRRRRSTRCSPQRSRQAEEQEDQSCVDQEPDPWHRAVTEEGKNQRLSCCLHSVLCLDLFFAGSRSETCGLGGVVRALIRNILAFLVGLEEQRNGLSFVFHD